MKKYFEVSLISKTVQTKFVLAENEEQAMHIADQWDWNQKEEVLENETEAKEVGESAIIGRIVETETGSFTYNDKNSITK